MKTPHTKNTLLQAATLQPTNQSLQESIFSPPQEKLKNKKFPTLQKNKTSFHRTVQTLTDIALNVNRFEQSACGLRADRLRGESITAHNIRLKEIKKRRALRGKQRVELLTNSVGKRTVVLLNPSFFYFFNPFFVTGHARTTTDY